MPRSQEPDTAVLVERARQGDPPAREQLLARHRVRLRRFVALRLDRRVLARVDPSDVVQETLANAARHLSDYLMKQPLPFYPWLRQIAIAQVIDVHRRHVQAHRRSVRKEERWNLPLPNESALELVDRLIDYHSSPSKRVLRDERRQHMRSALGQLSERDREVLILRHLEQLSSAETAAILGISEGAVKLRLLRALERVRKLWTAEEQRP